MSVFVERVQIGGRSGTASYIVGDFEPSDKEHADRMKVIFDDGDCVIYDVERSDA